MILCRNSAFCKLVLTLPGKFLCQHSFPNIRTSFSMLKVKPESQELSKNPSGLPQIRTSETSKFVGCKNYQILGLSSVIQPIWTRPHPVRKFPSHIYGIIFLQKILTDIRIKYILTPNHCTFFSSQNMLLGIYCPATLQLTQNHQSLSVFGFLTQIYQVT